jgi:hypothetical protein
VAGIGLDFVADMADVDVDGPLVLLERVVVVADELEELAARVDPARPRGEVAEDVELRRRQCDPIAAAAIS